MLREIMLQLQVLYEGGISRKSAGAQMTCPALPDVMLGKLMLGPCHPIWKRKKHTSTVIKGADVGLEICKDVHPNSISMFICRARRSTHFH